jgi:hypothetical protein
MIAQFAQVPAPVSSDGEGEEGEHSTVYEVQLLF